MSKRHDEDQITLHGVDEREGEFPKHELTQPRVYRNAQLGLLEHQLDGSFNFIQEPAAEPRNRSLIPQTGFMKLELRIRMELKPHPPSRVRSLVIVSGPGMPCTEPSTSSR